MLAYTGSGVAAIRNTVADCTSLVTLGFVAATIRNTFVSIHWSG